MRISPLNINCKSINGNYIDIYGKEVLPPSENMKKLTIQLCNDTKNMDFMQTCDYFDRILNLGKYKK